LAVQYAFFKDMASSKGNDLVNKLGGKIESISFRK
jgi:hypothetical protein